MQPIIEKGVNNKIKDVHDLFHLSNDINISKHHKSFEKKLMETDKKGEGKVHLKRALLKAFWWEVLTVGFFRISCDLIEFCYPILLNNLILFFEKRDEPLYMGFVYSASLFVAASITGVIQAKFAYHINTTAGNARISVLTAVYSKALSANSVSMSKFTTGEVINFMGSDADKISGFFHCVQWFWCLPFRIVLCTLLLYQQVGVSALSVFLAVFILLPSNRYTCKKVMDINKNISDTKDSRNKLMNEILSGIRVIKFYAWECHFTERINSLRDKELGGMTRRRRVRTVDDFCSALVPVLVSIVLFTSYTILGHELSAAKIFTCLLLVRMLMWPVNALPWVINGLSEGWLSMSRVQEFVGLPTLKLDQYYSKTDSDKAEKGSLAISDGHFAWKRRKTEEEYKEEEKEKEKKKDDKDENEKEEVVGETMKLTGIHVDIKKGQFVGVVGKVGSGKTSLLNSLLAEMEREGGRVTVGGLEEGFAYAPQEPWIQQATLRDNVLFGCELRPAVYSAVLEGCALKDDLKQLAAGDKTEIGESGVTLSGGQKARVALARAVYQDKAVYLLDDPLAAVDAHVAMHLYSRCIMGLLRDKTRVLCTHHTKFLAKADLVILMEDGKIAKAGPPDEVLPSLDESKLAEGQEPKGSQMEEGGQGDDLVKEEEKEEGSVKLHVYKSYCRAVGTGVSLAVVLALVATEVFSKLSDWWLPSNISKDFSVSMTTESVNSINGTCSAPSPMNHPTDVCPMDQGEATEAAAAWVRHLLVYGLLAGGDALFNLVRSLLVGHGGLQASTKMHQNLLCNVLKAPLSFFESTPVGRLLNRFSTDVSAVDDSLPNVLNGVLHQTVSILACIVATCYNLPWFLMALIPIALINFKLQRYFRTTSLELRRISSVTRSPIFSHFSETLAGLPAIRAMRATDRFEAENLNRVDLNRRANVSNLILALWLHVRIEFLSAAMVSAAVIIALVQHHVHGLHAGVVGLALTYMMSVVEQMKHMMHCTTETEKQFVSVERLRHYTEDTPSEAWEGACESVSSWPSAGVVELRGASFRYRSGLPNALDQVTLTTRPAEKVGVVGRTGSGKSSLFLSLFRMVELHEGQILIDDQDISKLSLTALRRGLAIIPQDPFLFSGTVQDNLDPTGRFQDHALWEALDKCHLRVAVERLGGLGAQVSEKGKVFSLGQRQLLCLARAVLVNAKVLCIDEATASVDLETDQLIQQTLRTEFASSTVITIAHRINTVMDSDRILLLQKGKVEEFAPPDQLLADPKSLFYQLVHGKAEDSDLH